MAFLTVESLLKKCVLGILSLRFWG